MRFRFYFILFSLHRLYLQVCHSTSLASFPLNRAYPDGDTMSEMRYAYTKFLIVTRYLLCWVRDAVCAFAMRSLCLRYGSASGSLPSMEHQRTYNGFTTDLRRSWKLSQNLIEACINSGDGFVMVFTFLHRFSSILNKVNQPGINAYCYLLRLSAVYTCPIFIYNSLIIFILDIHKTLRREGLQKKT